MPYKFIDEYQWMTCNTCKEIVISNETGICLACQGCTGITSDNFMHIKAKEIIYAAEKRKKQENSEREYKQNDAGGLSAKTSGRSGPPNCS